MQADRQWESQKQETHKLGKKQKQNKTPKLKKS